MLENASTLRERIFVYLKKTKVLSCKFFKAYFNSWWLPFVTMLCVLLTIKAAAVLERSIPFFSVPDFAVIILSLLVAVTAIGILLASGWNFARKRYYKGIVNFLATLAVVIVAVRVISMAIMFYRLLGPSEDGFADNLQIPQNVEISEPQRPLPHDKGESTDMFQTRLLSVLNNPDIASSLITAELTSLVKLQETAPAILRRYLATTPCWRVFKERSAVFATRRWMIGSNWLYSLHGYYSQRHLGFFGSNGVPDFSYRMTPGFSGRPWARISDESTCIRYDQTLPVSMSDDERLQASHLVITCGELIAEFFERPRRQNYPLTRASLLYIEEEFQQLVESPEFSTVRDMLPSGSIRNGQPTIDLFESSQPGTYDSQVWVNPGEPGMIYFKAYEITKHTRLSARELERYSNEWIGWSDDPSELFFSNTHFTVYEGDWGKPYAARFEVWFLPDSGRPERKLTERLFTIEGWQR